MTVRKSHNIESSAKPCDLFDKNAKVMWPRFRPRTNFPYDEGSSSSISTLPVTQTICYVKKNGNYDGKKLTEVSVFAETATSFSGGYYQIWSFVVVLRSEIPSGISAKLRTVAASNNRVHMP